MERHTKKRIRKSLKRTRFLQPKRIKDSKYIKDYQYVKESAEKHVKSLSEQIFWGDEEINRALLQEKYLPRKLNQWMKEARILRCQASDVLQEEKNFRTYEKLKDMLERTFSHLKHCPIETMNDEQLVASIASMSEIKDTKLKTYRGTESDDQMTLNTSVGKADNVMKMGREAVDALVGNDSSRGNEFVEGESSQGHDPVVPEILPDQDSNIPPAYISELQPQKTHVPEITEQYPMPGDSRVRNTSRIKQKMPLIYTPDPHDESVACSSEADQVEPDITVPHALITRPAQSEDFHFSQNTSDLGKIFIKIPSMTSERPKCVCLVLGNTASHEMLISNNHVGLDLTRDHYVFSELPDYPIINRDSWRPPTDRISPITAPNQWRAASVLLLMEKDIVSLPEEVPDCPNVVLLFLQRNNRLTCIPPSFFNHMPALCFLDLSSTKIMELPSSLFKLTNLQVLMLRSCVCLDSLPTEIKNLINMEVLDLSGTELYDLPKEIDQLTRLRHLQLSFYGPDDESEYARLPSQLFSVSIISELQALQELGIVVHPEDHRWTNIAEGMIEYVARLSILSSLQFYFPTLQALQYFINESLSWKEQRLKKFKFVVGHNVKRIISRVPSEVETKYDKHDQCLKFVNGDHAPEAVKMVLVRAAAFYLDHHLNIRSLSEFGISNFEELKFCLVRECPNIQVLIKAEERSENAIFPNLEHLGVHYLWELEKVCDKSLPSGSFHSLKYLMVDKCPKQEFIVSHSVLQCFSNLEEFVVQDCKSLKTITKENEMDQKKNYDNTNLLPQLKNLVLRHLPKLDTLGGGLMFLPQEKISVHCCPNLTLNPQLQRVKKRKFSGSSSKCSICICACLDLT